jgi:alanyl-tRNA synthetase
MKDRLYFKDPWQNTFEAAVEAEKEEAGGKWLLLSQSVFYPEGGGQPGDTGRLFYDGLAYPISDTQSDAADRVWHRVEQPEGAKSLTAGDRVQGEIDWARRHDHMQQHTGEHILAYCVWKLAGGYVHGLHIGQTESSIDVSLPEGQTRLSKPLLGDIETLANQIIARDDEIICRFPEPRELESLPLRKIPGEHAQTRVVLMGGYEGVACGGTHLSRTSQAGMVKILRDQSARGKMRLFFLCGLRAVRHYQATYEALDRASSLLNTPLNEVPQALANTLEKQNELNAELNALRQEMALSRLPVLIQRAEALPDGNRLITAELTQAEAPALEALASALSEEPRLIALLCAPQGDKVLFSFSRQEGAGPDLSALMRETGIKGGGRPAFARGAGQAADLLRQAAQILRNRALAQHMHE